MTQSTKKNCVNLEVVFNRKGTTVEIKKWQEDEEEERKNNRQEER